LPTIRALSERLNVNPNTVAKAYRELELKGIIVSERGSGSFIQAQPPALTPGTSTREKKAKLKNLYHRLLADAASSGLTESELLSFIKEKNTSTL
jgi:GntR family transcriptional regulator